MKFSQVLTHTDVTSAEGELPWQQGMYKEKACQFLAFTGCNIYKLPDGKIIIKPDNISLPEGYRSYTINIASLTEGQSFMIQIGEETLRSGHHYLLTMQGSKIKPDQAGYELESRAIEIYA